MVEISLSSTITCPHCESKEEITLSETSWDLRRLCKSCNKMIEGGENIHGWRWVFCTHGNNPWLAIQRKNL